MRHSAWNQIIDRYKHMFLRRHVALMCCAWVLLFVLSVTMAASGQLKPVAFGMASSISGQFLPHDGLGRTNILLLGVGDREHAGADLTDSIILASIDPGTRSISLLSLPRDLYLTEPIVGPPGRINAMYYNYKTMWKKEGATASGVSILALKSMAEDLGGRLNLPIHGIAKVDFTAFTEIIDAFGGIDLDVPEALTDYTYPLEEGVVGTYSVSAGPHHFDGEEALRYARSRHSTSDFDRSLRQQQILGALLEKIAAQNPLENLGLARSILQAVEKHAEWTFTGGEIIAIGGTVLGIPRNNILSMHLNTQIGGDYTQAERGGFVLPGGDITNAAVLIPYSRTGDPSDWGQLIALSNLLFSHRELFLEDATITITADPKATLQAQRLKNELIRYGFDVPGKILKAPIVGSGGVIVGRDAYVPEFLTSYVDVPQTMSGSMKGNVIQLHLPKDYRFETMEKYVEAGDKGR